MVAASVQSFAELLDGVEDAALPDLQGTAIHQPHCHQQASTGSEPDQRLLRRLGIDSTTLDPSCCGLAGNFGFEAEHYEVSQAVGERVVLPAVREASDDTLVLADGYSCRTQIEQGTGRRSLHLAELLDAGFSAG